MLALNTLNIILFFMTMVSKMHIKPFVLTSASELGAEL